MVVGRAWRCRWSPCPWCPPLLSFEEDAKGQEDARCQDHAKGGAKASTNNRHILRPTTYHAYSSDISDSDNTACAASIHDGAADCGDPQCDGSSAAASDLSLSPQPLIYR